MADSPGKQMLNLLQRETLETLQAAAKRLSGTLDGLLVDPAFVPPFAGRVLGVIDPQGINDPVLSALGAVVGVGAGGVKADLHGWRDQVSEGAPRGLAYVACSETGVVLAITIVPDADPALAIRAVGFSGGESLTVSLPGGCVLRATGSITGEAEVHFFPNRGPEIVTLAAGDDLDISVVRHTTGRLLGVEGGPSVILGTVDAGVHLHAQTDGTLERSGHLTLGGGTVTLVPGFVKSLVPFDLTFPLSLDLTTSPAEGIVLAGSPSLRARVNGTDGRWLDLTIDISADADAPNLTVGFRTQLKITLPGAPVSVDLEGIGLNLPIGLRLGKPMLPSPGDVRGLEPDGAGVTLDLPVVAGSGMLTRVGEDLVGALTVRIPPMSAAAFGVLSPPSEGRPLSFLVILGATFPPPGVQIGFGFAISGVGGVVGINRRIDRDALIRAVSDGTAAQLMFPDDPVSAGEAAVRALPTLFPAASGSIIVGPMFQLSWGGRLVTLSVAVLVEASNQVRLTVLGKLVVAIPDPAAPLVFLQATFAGFIDPAEPSVMFVASLNGSHVVGAALSGDILLLVRGGSDPTMVLSAGGFHPAFKVPRGIPALRRLALDLSPVSWLDLRCEMYFAVTTNTLQLGARLDLVAEVAGCGLRGSFAFDALLQFDPFRFLADVSGGVSLRAFGETLVGIHLALHLEGPAPYNARGRGSIDLFLFEVSFDFEFGWGSPAPHIGPPPDIGAALRDALHDPASWSARGAGPQGLVLTAGARKVLDGATIVDPYGVVSVHQSLVPLGIDIQLFNGFPVPRQRWDLAGGEFGPGEPVDHVVELRAQFAPGQFVPHATDDEALSAAAFLSLRAGLELHPAPAVGADARAVHLDWEERVNAPDLPKPLVVLVGLFCELEAVESVVIAMSATDPGWWPVPAQIVTVMQSPPVTAAYQWSMTGEPSMSAANSLELSQSLVGAEGMMGIEAWEANHG